MKINDFNFKKKFGQNFLIDRNIVLKIIESIDILDNSLVIEIGCGDGRLTCELCNNFNNVIGYEIDVDVKEKLLNNLSSFNNYEIIFDDFINRDIVSDINKYEYSNLYVVANLPYYITTPIIEKLIDSGLDITLMNFMVQKEVADRFCAKVGSKNYNSLTVYLNYKYDVKRMFIVNRKCFYPIPNVDSAIVSFNKKINKYNVINEEIFFKLVRDSFKYKRKTLRNNLIDYDLNKISSVLVKYGFDLSVRAEQLDINIFCDIANELSI